MKKNETNFAIQELANQDQKDYLLNANFTIVDKNNNPISGVSVSGGGKSVTTTINGIGVLLGLKNQEAEITISKEGYVSKTVTVVKNIQQQTFTVTLNRETKTIVVEVTDGTSAIEGASITLTDTADNTNTVTGTTDNNGEASIVDVAVGSYTATISADGYTTLTSSADVTSSTTKVTFEIVAVPVSEEPSSNQDSNNTSSDNLILGVQLDNNLTVEFGNFSSKLTYTGDLNIDWGDNTTPTTYTNGTLSHTYGESGEYQITITGNITGIEDYALQDINEVTIPSSVTSIGNYVFGLSIETVTFKSTTPPTLSDSTFYVDAEYGFIIRVPAGSLTTYQNTSSFPDENNSVYSTNYELYTIEEYPSQSSNQEEQGNANNQSQQESQNSSENNILTITGTINEGYVGEEITYILNSCTGNITVDWGDNSNIETYTENDEYLTHPYYNEGEYNITITGNVNDIDIQDYHVYASSVNIPSSITSITLPIHPNLSSIYFNSITPPTISKGDYNNVTVYVPTGSLSAYQSAWDYYDENKVHFTEYTPQ